MSLPGDSFVTAEQDHPPSAAESGRQWFAQLSDLHLTSLAGISWRELSNKRLLGYLSWRRKRRFEHRPEVLAAVLQDLHQWPLAQLLITGDLTHIGTPEEYVEVARWLATVGAEDEIQLVPGNHDAYAARDWPQVLEYWDAYLRSDSWVDGQRFPSLRVRGGLAFIGLSTACPTRPLLATGTVGAAQREALSALLEQTREQGLFRVVFLHHNPVPGEEKWRKRLTDAAQLEAVIAAGGAELVLHGHGHRAVEDAIASAHGEIPVYAVPSASANGRHQRPAAGYNCYAVDPAPEGWRLEVHMRSYQPQRGDFVTTARRTLTLPRR